jgi:hypothetical protein
VWTTQPLNDGIVSNVVVRAEGRLLHRH